MVVQISFQNHGAETNQERSHHFLLTTAENLFFNLAFYDKRLDPSKCADTFFLVYN